MSFQVRQSLKLFGAPEPEPTPPLSLQQTSKLYVISNLEEFPPDVLAKLALRFRCDRLLMLPPADIFQLEQTSVADGIDMENEIWKEVYEHYDYEDANEAHIALNQCFEEKHRDFSLPKALESRKKALTWKASLLSCIFVFCFIYNHLKSTLCA